MTTVSYHFEAPARAVLSTGGISAAAQLAMTAEPASPEGADPQERRWQLEWERRHVED